MFHYIYKRCFAYNRGCFWIAFGVGIQTSEHNPSLNTEYCTGVRNLVNLVVAPRLDKLMHVTDISIDRTCMRLYGRGSYFLTVGSSCGSVTHVLFLNSTGYNTRS